MNQRYEEDQVTDKTNAFFFLDECIGSNEEEEEELRAIRIRK